MSFNNFDTLPHNASTDIKPFNVAIPQQDLDNLTTLLKLSRLPPPTYENSLPAGGGPRLGLRRDWLSAAKQYWETEFDWRKCEQHFNTFPHFTAPISIHLADYDGHDHQHDHDHDHAGPDSDMDTSTSMDIAMDIHFVALFSHRHDAIPILLLHGWPGSFLEFLPILDHLRSQYTADTLPYHVIVPSLPGYAFSTPPPWNATFRPADAARVFDTLATTALGFKSYMVQGGDLGGRIARIIAATYPKCKAVHLNTHPMPAPDASVRLKLQSAINDTEQAGLERHNFFLHNGTAYAFEHATRPATIGAVLSSNPLALLAWIGEKFLDWTDDPHPSLDTILESVTLYWLTNCAATSLYSYRGFYGPNADSHGSPKWHIPHNKPLGYSWFPKEINPIPRAWIETTGNLVFYRQHEKGGHFAALERPEDLWADVDEFAQSVKDVFRS